MRTGTRRRKPRREQPGQGAGIITAEELVILKLSNCELAVLSACGTNVGIRRAGQGIQSLQSALHAAGARTSLTSPWKVDDAAPRRLMELFYTRLWEEKFTRTLQRDKMHERGLRRAGWRVRVIWECQLGDTRPLARKLAEFLEQRNSAAVTSRLARLEQG